MIVKETIREVLLRGMDSSYAVALYTGVFSGTVYTKEGEAVGTGYRAGGLTVGSPEVTCKSSATCVSFRGIVEWKNSTIKARSAIIYGETSGEVLYIMNFGKVVSSTNDSFKLEMPDSPLITWQT